MKQQTHPPPQIMDDTAQKPKCTIFPSFKRVNWSLRQRKSDRKWKKKKKWNGIRTPWYKSLVGYHFPFTTVYSNHVQPNVRIHLVSVFIFQVFFVLFYSRWRSVLQTEVLGKYNSSFRWSKLPNLQIKCIENWVWDTSTRRSHSAQITSPRVVRKSCLNPFAAPSRANTNSSTILDTWKNLFVQPHQTELSSYKEENRIHAKTSTLRL